VLSRPVEESFAKGKKRDREREAERERGRKNRIEEREKERNEWGQFKIKLATRHFPATDINCTPKNNICFLIIMVVLTGDFTLLYKVLLNDVIQENERDNS
jgi:hypothetical protein